MDDVERLLAIEEIKQLKARYFRCVDTRDWQGFANVFAPNAEFRVTWSQVDDEENIIRGNQVISDFIRSQMEGLKTVHHGFMPEIEVTSPTTASGVWAMEDFIRRPAGDGTWSMHGFGHYHETYERVDGEWRIATWELTRLRLDETAS